MNSAEAQREAISGMRCEDILFGLILDDHPTNPDPGVNPEDSWSDWSPFHAPDINGLSCGVYSSKLDVLPRYFGLMFHYGVDDLKLVVYSVTSLLTCLLTSLFIQYVWQ